MFKKILFTFVTGVLLTIGIKPSMASTVIEKVARSGFMTVGVPMNAVPYSYINAEDQLDGFSIDLVKLIHQQLEEELDRNIKLDFVQVESIRDGVPKLLTGEIDMVCNTVFTWQRDRYVDYTLRYTVSGIRLLFPKGKIPADTSMTGMKIGIPPQTFVSDAVKLAHPNATFVDVATFDDGGTALKEGTIDALAGDTMMLDGLRQQINPDGFEQYPPLSETPYARFGVGCIVAPNNSTFLDVANFTIARMMEGYLVNDPEMTALVNKWMGENGVVSIVSPEAIKSFFENTINNHEQIPFGK
ncbi:extracellular substrate binding-like orphan protein GrrP [Geminocystis sp. CENA526]|uniref:extracellular substrate binding-like orphan protein GrrP n=1 Tax=Geminocystis sp. CENA526 TaxID=1355871 RepID=UPI003D6EEE32